MPNPRRRHVYALMNEHSDSGFNILNTAIATVP